MPSALPEGYLERIYAGVLGKLIGVYLGRPFENWTYQEIQERLGDITYYVHEKFNEPLVVIDDDVSGTFTFPRALDEHACGADLTPEHVGKTWLNQVIDKRTVFWWGGHGISTEHTTFNNLKRGIKPPLSGSIEKNGKTLAEQIGAQIFIDGWAMAAPGNPGLAAKLSEAAARVSHDGVAVDAAVLWAVMEAEAFVSSDVEHLLDTGLSYIHEDSPLRKLISDIRSWVQSDANWRKTRQRIEDDYGYDKYNGICHMIPNHGIMIMALLYAGHSFSDAMHIINTCGWDTDCNSGNVGCLVAIINGLKGFENTKGLDWRGPLADRALISSADSSYSVNDAVRITYDLANMAHRLAGEDPLPAPKDGAQWHFSLPGSVQGFQASSTEVQLTHELTEGTPALRIDLQRPKGAVEILTQTFSPQDALAVKRDYELMACPLVHEGQTLIAVVSSPSSNPAPVEIRMMIKAYDNDDKLIPLHFGSLTLQPGTTDRITIDLTSTQDGITLSDKPIQQVGIAIDSSDAPGTVYLHSLKCSGTPHTRWQRPPLSTGPGVNNVPETMWQYQWVSSVDKVHTKFGPSFYFAQDYGEGLFYTGTRQWTDYTVVVKDFMVNMGSEHGVIAYVQGLNRWYGISLKMSKNTGKGTIAIVKAKDEEREVLAESDLDWKVDTQYEMGLTIKNGVIRARFSNDQMGRCEIEAEDAQYQGGAAGFIVGEGSISAEVLELYPCSNEK